MWGFKRKPKEHDESIKNRIDKGIAQILSDYSEVSTIISEKSNNPEKMKTVIDRVFRDIYVKGLKDGNHMTDTIIEINIEKEN